MIKGQLTRKWRNKCHLITIKDIGIVKIYNLLFWNLHELISYLHFDVFEWLR